MRKKHYFNICLLLLLLLVLPAMASASLNVTQEQAVNWVLGLEDANWGSSSNVPNYDGSSWTPGDLGEPQCVDLTAAYLDYIGAGRIGGNANDYAGRASLPADLSYQCSARPGDIVVWKDSNYGHVGVVYAVDGNNFWYVDTRGDYNSWTDGNGYVHNTGAKKRGPKDYATTFIRPDFKQNEVSFDVNFTVDGVGKEYIYGIGDISVVVGGEVMTYQDKQHSSATTSYSDFCRNVPGGKEYEVRVNITDTNYYCSGVNQGKMIGTTSSNIVVNLNITSTKPERVLPDGDYLIISSASENKSVFFYLDIEGSAQPATNETNVSLCGPLTGDKLTNVPEYEIWTLTYGSDGFYTIKQKGTNMVLDVYGGSNAARANVSVHQGNDSKAQKWAITKNGSNGYRLQARCSAMYLDIKGGQLNASGTNVQQYPTDGGNATTSHSWLFIPYKPSQPIENGRYVLLYGGVNGYELDVPGNTGNIENGTPVQIWDSNALSQFNSFEFIKLSNGYYKVKHIVSGKCLDVTGGLRDYKSKVKLYEDNDSIAQQWAVVPNENGYSIIARCNGYALDLPDGTTTNGTSMEVYPRLGNDHQRWIFAEAEHTVSFDANQGTNPPAAQIKYYNNPMTLTTAKPSRDGYVLLGWSTNPNAETAEYLVGGEFLADKDTILYAIWESMTYTLTYDANEGSGAPAAVTVEGGGTIALSMDKPVREGYDFLGWSLNPEAAEAEYQPGDVYPGRKGTLYAVWKIKEFIVSFLSEGAGPFDPIHVAYGQAVGVLPAPERKGYFFKGWFDQNDNKVTAETIIKSALTLTANWAEPSTLVLPAFLTDIEDEAFEGIDANIIIIPETVKTIGSKAFANNDNLYLVYVYSTTVSPTADAFLNCPNLTICGYADKPIQYYAVAKNIPFVPLGFVSNWVQESELPVGAHVIEDKWTYTLTTINTTTSTESSLAGWTQVGFDWQQMGTGTWKYASYPGGFDTGSNLYSKYNKSVLPEGEQATGETTKRIVNSGSEFVTYIYWHWTFVDSLNSASDSSNVLVEDAKKYNILTGNVYRDYVYFDAFEDTVDHGTWGPGTSGQINVDPMRYAWRGVLGDVSHWWWIFEVRQQTYTDYQKLFTYMKEESENLESSTEVASGDDISNIQHWVKYGF